MKLKKRVFKILFIVAIILLAIAILSKVWLYYVGIKDAELTKEAADKIYTISTSSNAGWKTFTFTGDHFKLNIPSDWQVSGGTLDDGSPTAYLTSPDKQIVIFTPGNIYSFDVTKDLNLPEIQLGPYKAERHRVPINDTSTLDFITLNNPPLNQSPVSFSFDIKGDFKTNNALLLKILKTFAYTQQEQPIYDAYSYKLPKNWVEAKDKGTLFETLDVKNSLEGGVTNGLEVEVGRSYKPGMTINNLTSQTKLEATKPGNAISDIQPIKVGGADGLTYHSNWESHVLNYLTINQDHVWQISILSPNLDQENEHKQEIDSFISSIKFK